MKTVPAKDGRGKDLGFWEYEVKEGWNKDEDERAWKTQIP